MRALLCTVFVLNGALFAQDAAEIVRKSIERDWTDFESVKNYTYQEHSEFRQYKRDGSLGSKRSQTNEILILAGRPYERLLARDDKPLSEKESQKEQQKLDRELERRQRESESDRSKYQKERIEERRFIREIPDAFTFRLDKTEDVSRQPAWVIDAEPKPGYRPIESRAKIFPKIRAKIWIEQATYHWVKVDAEVLDTISAGLGMLRVAPGGTLHFEQTRVNDEIWLPASIQVRADARLALVKKLRAEFDIQYSDYKKFQSDSRIIGIEQ